MPSEIDNVQIKDASTAIPRNSLIEANQSGLIAEPLVDITPQLPIPQYQARGPHVHASWERMQCCVLPYLSVSC